MSVIYVMLSTATGKVKALQVVNADHNKFKKIPPKTFTSDTLFSINLSHNHIRTLPRTVYKRPIAYLNVR